MTRLENGPVISTDPDDWFQLNKEHCQNRPPATKCPISGSGSFWKVPSPEKPIKLKVRTNFQPRGDQEEKAKDEIQITLHPWLAIGSLKSYRREVCPLSTATRSKRCTLLERERNRRYISAKNVIASQVICEVFPISPNKTCTEQKIERQHCSNNIFLLKTL